MRNVFLAVLGVWTAVLTASPAGAADTAAANTEWKLLGGNSEMQHYSPLNGINDKTVGTLGLAWYADLPTREGTVGNPLVADGVVFQSGAMSAVFATDIRTGKLLWQYAPKLDYQRDFVGLWAIRTNRGLALWNDKVIIGTGDCRVIALDRKTGKPVWEAKSCNPADSVGITGAPRVGGGMVFVGNACADTGLSRGFIDAFDAETGAHKWRFYTVPSSNPAENDTPIMKKAAASWGKDEFKNTKGCGSPWDAITYDPVLKQLYFGVAGPAPWNPQDRAPDMGDELFSTAIVAVNAETGAYAWHYTTTPHDAWNFDATMHIMIADLPIDGSTRRVVMQAPKNGFFYVLDAKTGKLLRANNFAKVTWASHIDMQTGRPVEIPGARYYEQPDHRAVVSPGPGGAHNWYAMSYYPKTGLVYIPSSEFPTYIEVMSAADAEGGIGVGGTLYYDLLYGLHNPKYRDQMYGELIGWDPVANKARWRTRQKFPVNGGTLATAGNLVFEGTTDGKFKAFSATAGKELWSWQGEGAIQSAPTTVSVDGAQYVIIASGNATTGALTPYFSPTAVATSRGPSRLLAFRLGGTAKLPTPAAEPPFAKPPLARVSEAAAKHGAMLYLVYSCDLCHGADAVGSGGGVPDLRRMSEATHKSIRDIVKGGARRALGMPQFVDMGDDTLAAIEAYVTSEAWIAYDRQESRKKKGQSNTPQ
jgi:quinohemoprotein ethanol dehydrogenase